MQAMSVLLTIASATVAAAYAPATQSCSPFQRSVTAASMHRALPLRAALEFDLERRCEQAERDAAWHQAQATSLQSRVSDLESRLRTAATVAAPSADTSNLEAQIVELRAINERQARQIASQAQQLQVAVSSAKEATELMRTARTTIATQAAQQKRLAGLDGGQFLSATSEILGSTSEILNSAAERLSTRVAALPQQISEGYKGLMVAPEYLESGANQLPSPLSPAGNGEKQRDEVPSGSDVPNYESAVPAGKPKEDDDAFMMRRRLN